MNIELTSEEIERIFGWFENYVGEGMGCVPENHWVLRDKLEAAAETARKYEEIEKLCNDGFYR